MGSEALKKNEDTRPLSASEIDKRKSLYLEARLASKVIVSPMKPISGGATVNVFMLKSLSIKECLKDLQYYVDSSSKNKLSQLNDDLIESLASIVEFDGLETTQDPSPRSSLTLSMYNSQKAIYVQRMLGERVVPLVDAILSLFELDTVQQCKQYIIDYYPTERMVKLRQ